MKVFTRSDYARDAQNGVMEFLSSTIRSTAHLRQGGECQLQDSRSATARAPRATPKEARGAEQELVRHLADMTRCIHCTRCVRSAGGRGVRSSA